MSNPYVAGSAVGGSHAFFGRETILRRMLRTIQSTSENAFVLYGQRRIGKTSVLLEFSERVSHDVRYHPVYFDLQDKASLPLARIVQELARRLAAKLALPPPPDWGQDAPEEFEVRFLPELLRDLEGRGYLVILFDEFDVLDAPNEHQAGLAFFPYLRNLLAIGGPVSYIFALGRNPDDLSRLLLSVFKDLPCESISLLSRQETENLVRASEDDGSLMWSSGAVATLVGLTGGHPLLTQQLCQEIWDQSHSDGAGSAETRVSPEAVKRAVPATLRAVTNAMEWLWEGIGPTERIVASALAQAGSGFVTQRQLATILEQYGAQAAVGEFIGAPGMLQAWDLIETRHAEHRFRVELIRRWISERKPLSRVREEIERVQPAAHSLFLLANAYHRSANLLEALPLLRQAVKLNPSHERATLLLGETLLALQISSEARDVLEQLYRKSPDRARSRLVQALMQLAEKDLSYEDRIDNLERILELEPGYPDACRLQARLFKELGIDGRGNPLLDVGASGKPSTGGDELSASSPLDHLRLLWWFFMAPKSFIAYRIRYGEESIFSIGKWTVGVLIWLPHLLLCLAYGLGIIPRSSASSGPAFFLAGALALVLAMYLTVRALGSSKDEGTAGLWGLLVAPAIGYIVTRSLLVSVASTGVDFWIGITALSLSLGVPAGMTTAYSYNEDDENSSHAFRLASPKGVQNLWAGFSVFTLPGIAIGAGVARGTVGGAFAALGVSLLLYAAALIQGTALTWLTVQTATRNWQHPLKVALAALLLEYSGVVWLVLWVRSQIL